jgi:hypothetical protein
MFDFPHVTPVAQACGTVHAYYWRGGAEATEIKVNTPENSPSAMSEAPQKVRALHQSEKLRAMRKSFACKMLVPLLAVAIVLAPLRSAFAQNDQTLELPQRFDPSVATPTPGYIQPDQSKYDNAEAAPQPSPEAASPPQMAGVDQYVNQNGSNNGSYPAANNPYDPGAAGSSQVGPLLLGGLLLGAIALELALGHHHR